MSKFKIGDKVILKKTDLTDRVCGRFNFDDMLQVGDTGTVDEVGVTESDTIYIMPFWYHQDDLELAPKKVKPEIKVNYILLPDSITLAFNSQMISIAKGDHRYSAIIEAVKNDSLELIPDLVDVAKSFSNIDGLELVEGRIRLFGKDIPEVVSDRVLRFKEQGLPFEPLVKFAEKLLKNPSFRSRKMLYQFLEHNGHPITKDGNFIAYKKVKENFKDCYSGTMDNSVGKTITMDRRDVDDDPANTCSSGLHVAAYNYASTFSHGHLLEVEIDPEDVVAVPNDYDGEKMRVCKYIVRGINESKLEDVDLYDDDEDEWDYDDDEYSDENSFWGV
jgi:hypothetical protein